MHTNESVQAKIFIEFVAWIIRSRFYTCFKELMQKSGKKNYMTAPATIRELEKIKLRSKELMAAFANSERSFEEVMRFLSGKEVDDE